MSIITEIAKMIDHSLLSPTLTDEGLKEGCNLAKEYNVASVCVKPYAVKLAKEWLRDSDVLVGTVIGFPHGNSSIDVKVFETQQAIDDGAVEIDMVINLGKATMEDWTYIEKEISAIRAVTAKSNIILKVIFENDLITETSHKIKLCEICNMLKVDFVKTSTGYNYVKGDDGRYSYKGATDDDLKLMRKYSAPEVQVKAAGAVGSLEAILRVRDLGVTRIGTGQTAQILDDANVRYR